MALLCVKAETTPAAAEAITAAETTAATTTTLRPRAKRAVVYRKTTAVPLCRLAARVLRRSHFRKHLTRALTASRETTARDRSERPRQCESEPALPNRRGRTERKTTTRNHTGGITATESPRQTHRDNHARKHHASPPRSKERSTSSR